MQRHTRFWPRLGALGIVYAALFLVANVLIGSAPSAGSTGAAVVKYYQAHKASEIAGVFVAAVAVVAFTFFLGSLRHALGRTEEGRELASIVTAGGAVYVLGLMIMASLAVALVDTAHYHMTGAAQTLNVLGNDDWVPVVVGLSLVTLGTGVSALRHGSLPKWLAWSSVALGVVSLAGPAGAIAFLLAPLWAVVVGVVIFRTAPEPESELPTSATRYSATAR